MRDTATGASRPVGILAAFAAFMLAAPSVDVAAAPLPPVRPADFCGTVVQIGWLEPTTRPGVKGMSGSAGQERLWPGRYRVVLANLSGVSPETVALINNLLSTSADGAGVNLGEGELLTVLPVQAEGLQAGEGPVAGDRICVEDFTIRGDEGGTWTGYAGVEIIRR